MENWIGKRDVYLERMAALGQSSDLSVSNLSGSIVLMHAKGPGFNGQGTELPYAVLGLCTGGGGRTHKEADGRILDDVWRPGRVGLALPGSAATGYTPPMSMLAICFDLNELPACHGRKLQRDELIAGTTRLFDDTLASSVMTALMHDAELHGASSIFFEHGISLVVHRLAELAGLSPQANARKPVDSRLRSAIEHIEDRLSDDLRVNDLAQISALDSRSFTRAFKKETGYTPFVFITKKRMEMSKTYLLQTDWSITKIAISVGYANPAKFSAAFRRWNGETPSNWKSQRTQ